MEKRMPVHDEESAYDWRWKSTIEAAEIQGSLGGALVILIQ